MLRKFTRRTGDAKWGLIALLLGLPLPIVIIAFLFIGGCGGCRG
jgi:Na+-driven multidrug efflux pump